MEDSHSLDKTYNYLKELGSGTFGTVMLNSNGDAVKITKNKYPFLPHNLSQVEAVVSRLVPENAYLLKSKGVLILEDDTLIILPAAESDLYEYINANPSLPNIQLKNILYQVALGIANLHNLGLVHGDVKINNVLMMPDGVVVADYGTATWYCVHDIRTGRATYIYASPEDLSGKEDLTPKIDVWAWGVLAFVIYTRNYPFEGTTSETVLQSINDKNIYDFLLTQEDIPRGLKSLLSHVFQPEITRITIFEVLQDEFFDEVRGEVPHPLNCQEIRASSDHVYPDAIQRWGNAEVRRRQLYDLTANTNVWVFLTIVDILDRYLPSKRSSRINNYTLMAWSYVLNLRYRSMKPPFVPREAIKEFIDFTNNLDFQPYSFLPLDKSYIEMNRYESSNPALAVLLYQVVSDPLYPTWTYDKRVEIFKQSSNK